MFQGAHISQIDQNLTRNKKFEPQEAKKGEEVTVSTSRDIRSENKKIKNIFKDVEKIKLDETDKTIKNEGNKTDKMLKTKSNHNLKFRSAGPGILIGAGTEKIGGRIGACYGPQILSDGPGKLGNWRKAERGLETERPWEQPRDTPDK